VERGYNNYPKVSLAFLDPSDSYFLFADFVDFYTYWTYILYMPIFSRIFSATIDGRNLIFGYKLHIGTPYRGKRFNVYKNVLLVELSTITV
jgi:hypothetical protein